MRDVTFLTSLPGKQDRASGERLREALRKVFRRIHQREQMPARELEWRGGGSRRSVGRGNDPRTAEPTVSGDGETAANGWDQVLHMCNDAGHGADKQLGRTGA